MSEKPESLIDLSAQYRRLLDSAAEPASVDPETGEASDAFLEALAAVEDKLEQKIDGYGYVRAGLIHRAQELVNEAERLNERAEWLAKRVEQIEERARAALQIAGLSKVEGARWTLTVPKPPRKVDVYDAAALPREWWRVKPAPDPEPDKVALAKALKKGESVPGARLVDGETSGRWS